MGWIGWTAQEALATPVPLVELALEGRTDMLTTIYGDGKSKGKGRGKKVTAKSFKAFADRHNRGLAKG